MEDGDYRNWLELPPELTSSILHRLGAVEIIETAQKVCKSWRNICKDPSMWKKIHMYKPEYSESMGYGLEIMCRHAIDRSQGGLVEIALWFFGTDSLLNYIAERSSNLRSLKLVACHGISNEGFAEAVLKLPLLEELELSCCELSHISLKVVGWSCQNMETLKLIHTPDYNPHHSKIDDEALAIAETMPRLRHLQLYENRLTDSGLNAILDGCPHLEHLALRHCFNINLVGDHRS